MRRENGALVRVDYLPGIPVPNYSQSQNIDLGRLHSGAAALPVTGWILENLETLLERRGGSGQGPEHHRTECGGKRLVGAKQS